MIAFFGTSPRSAVFLEKAVLNGLKIDLVVSEPPKPVGKKQILTENPVISLSKKKGLSFVLSLSDLGNLGDLSLGLILDFNKIIPKETINLFNKSIINIHFSKLPQYRGPAPVQYTILNGDKEAWITYYLINEKLDAGEILAQTSLPLDLTETTETLYQKLIEKSAAEISGIIDNYLVDRVRPCQQQGASSITHKLTTENCKIDWTKSPEEIERLIRASYPEPTAWTMVKTQKSVSPVIPSEVEGSLRSSHEEISPCVPQTAGLSRNDKTHRLKILKAHLENGKLTFDLVQLEGKNPVTWKQFQEGYPEAESKQK